MTTALQAAVATLPEPVHSAHVRIIAESTCTLRTANFGERDAAVLERIALMESFGSRSGADANLQ